MKEKLRLLTNKEKGELILVFVTLIFASLGAFSRILNNGLTVYQQVYLRIFVAFLFGFLLYKKDLHFIKLKHISIKDWAILIFRAVAGYLFAVVLFSKAYILGNYGSVAFIQAIPMVPILGVILFKEKMTSLKLLFIIIAFIGILLVSISDFSKFSWGVGEFYSLVSAIFFGLTYVVRKWQSDYLNNKESAMIIFGIGGCVVFAASLLHREQLVMGSWSLILLIAILIAGFLNTINLFFINYGFEHVSAIVGGNILGLESVFGVLISVIFYHEFPTVQSLIGGLMILFSVYMMNSLERHKS